MRSPPDGITRVEFLRRAAVGLAGAAAAGCGRRGRAKPAASADPGAAPLPIEIGAAQLFVDDFLIGSQEGLRRTLCMPRKDNDGQIPVIAVGDEFGAPRSTLEANGTIVYDPRLRKYVMFALGFSPTARPDADRVQLFRFTSADGMAWVKGDDGTPQRVAMDLYDTASGKSATNIDLFSCTYDARDGRRPYKGWQHFANWGDGREGIYFVDSADGRTWRRGPQVVRSGCREIRQDGRVLSGPGDATVFARDPVDGRYLGSFRFASPVDVGPGNRLRSRAYAFVDRLDAVTDLGGLSRVDLVPAAAEARGDLPHDEYYASTAWRYESLWLGGLKVWHAGGDYPYSAAGCAFLKLAVSRDGLRWKKVSFPNDAGVPEVFIPNGPEGGSGGRNDGGYLTEFSQAPLRIGDELVFYYGCSSYGKNHPRDIRVSGGGIFRARLRPDGFVSVDAGTLMTKPLAFAGGDLTLNGVGPIAVEVLDTAGRRLAGAAVEGDSLRHEVAFGGRSLRAAAGGGGARLRFTVGEGGRLYSFTVA